MTDRKECRKPLAALENKYTKVWKTVYNVVGQYIQQGN